MCLTTPALPGPVGARPPAPDADQAPATKRSRPVFTSGEDPQDSAACPDAVLRAAAGTPPGGDGCAPQEGRARQGHRVYPWSA
ncbi:hypothetical protein G6F50_016710 [Rhizopus delemar]|uniref:Uncharacterized protein n=1 Tax=Rhizopus delemar TaxID=936053 RepID=A0A9P7C1U1_9FUNG|nr:hypothetical protein G6F50_016710 [Rhizopus delemar]